jgi:hypothetical protein
MSNESDSMRKWLLILIFLIFNLCSSNRQQKEWLLNRESIFTKRSSEHFNLYTFEGYLSEKTKLNFLNERESAYREISNFFGIKSNLEVNIFLFKNEQLKYNLTGHEGLGWGFDNNIVEVTSVPLKSGRY